MKLISALCISLSSNAQYIEQHFIGDTIAIDTAIVMDIHTYRNVRENTNGAVDIINVQKRIISDQDKIIVSKDSTISILDQRLNLKEEALLRKDEAILNLSFQFDQLDQHTEQTLQLIQSNQKKGFWKKPEFWIGVGLGGLSVPILK